MGSQVIESKIFIVYNIGSRDGRKGYWIMLARKSRDTLIEQSITLIRQLLYISFKNYT